MADISSVKLQDNQTYYFKDNSAIVSISRSGNTYTATRHDGTTFEFTQKDDNTTYTFEDGVNSFTVTPSNGTAQTVTVTPSIPNATQSSDGLMSATDKTKLDGVANGAEVNQNAFSNIKVGSTTLAADSKTDTLEFVAGDNITLTPTEVSDKITISSSYTNTTYTLTQDATDGHKFSLEGTDGYFKEITIPDANTTYTIEADTTNNKIKLISSSGSAVSITVPFATNATNATNATKATGDESGNNIKNTYAASFSISDHTITLKNKNGTSLGTVTVPDNNTTYSFATGDSNGQIKVTPSGGSAQNISVKGLGTAAFKNTTDTYSSSGTDPVTGKAVASALETLPTPMVFKGTLGTGGTISQLPTASASTVGNTYRVITNGTYAGQVAKDGDEFIGAELSSGVYSWVYIPSADEPSGTVTSVGITNGGGLSVSGSPITTSGTITISHADTSSQASVDNSGRTYIQDISLDTYGHVTKITSATETVVDTDRYVNSAGFAHDSTNDNVKMTLTRAGSDTATVTANIPKVSSSSAGVAPKGTAVSTQSQSTKFLREDGVWAKPSYTTNTNTTYTLGTSGNTVTLTPSSGSVQSITVPFATNATNATKATQDANGDVIATTYRKLSNNDFDTINATEVNAGDLIVTGVGRFTNGLYGDLSGTATKVSNSLKIQLNSGTTEGTNQFTYDGSAAKTVNITKSAIGLGNVDNTADANKNVASANTAGSATKATQDESGNNIKATYAASFSISDHTITLKNKNGVSLGTVTVPDNNDNTWRKVQVNGTDILGTATNTNPLNLKAGTNVSLTNSSGTVTIASTDTNTTYSLSASGESVVLSGSDSSSSTANLSSAFANYMPKAGGTFTGRVVYNNVSMPLAAGKVTGLTAGTTEIFKDAIAFSNPATSNDLGWIRVLGTGESDTVLEIATGDDGGGSTAEKIVARQYNTSNAIANEATLLDKSGNTTFPKNVTATKFIGALQGNADTATKLATARTINIGNDLQGSATFDGSEDITIDVTNYSCSVGGANKANYPWHRFAYKGNITSTYYDSDAIFDIRSQYNEGSYGRLKVSLRTNNANAAVNISATWIYRYNCSASDVKIACWGVTGQAVYIDVFIKCATYPRLKIYQPEGDRIFTLVDSYEVANTTSSDPKTSYEVYKTIEDAGTTLHNQSYTQIVAATDGGIVNSAITAQAVAWDNVTGKPSTYPPEAHSHGLLNSSFATIVANTTTDSGWSMINSTYNGFLLKSIRFNQNAPSWSVGNFGSGICFGGDDTKGVISVAYNSPGIKIAGGNGTKPQWWIGLTGTTGTTYNLSNFVTSDTKNTAGSTDTSSKIFLIGATSQAANPQTYSQDTAYVGTDGCLYSGGSKVLTAHQDISGKVSKTGDTMSGALTVEASNSYSSYNEGIRINAGARTFATLLMGGTNGTTSGTNDGAFWLGVYNTGTTARRLMIAHNGSTNTGTYFYASSSSDISPSLRVGSNLQVANVISANVSNSGTAGGISLYSTDPTSYGIAMRNTTNSGKHGYVQGDWGTYFYMAGATNRGWVFCNAGSGNRMSISNEGHIVTNGSLTLGGNTTNTSGVRQVYNSTTKSLDFVFVA